MIATVEVFHWKWYRAGRVAWVGPSSTREKYLLNILASAVTGLNPKGDTYYEGGENEISFC